MTENKSNKNISRVSIGTGSTNAPMKESVNAPSRQFNGSQDAPNVSSKGKQVSSKITAND